MSQFEIREFLIVLYWRQREVRRCLTVTPNSKSTPETPVYIARTELIGGAVSLRNARNAKVPGVC